MNTKFLPGSVIPDATLGARQVKVVANSGLPDRVGDVLVASGCDLRNYRKNPVVLWQHDPARPVGNASVYVAGDQLHAVITFAPAGASRDADEACALMKNGVVGAVSVGFKPISSEPIRGGLGGLKYTAWELCELSCVSVPCDPDALVIARSMQGKSGRVLSAQNSASVAALVRCLDRSADCHSDAVDMLDKADRHRARALNHAQQVLANAGNSGNAPDDPDDDSDDPEADAELSYGRARRKRLIAIAARAPGGDDLEAERRKRLIAIAARASGPPDADAERRRRMIKIAALSA
jgi:HK97 family phage prohead protease